MGSLPNLHELGREIIDLPNGHKMAPALGHLCGGTGNDDITSNIPEEAKSRMYMHRNSHTHAKLIKVRSDGHDPHKVDDFILEHMSGYSPISNRTTRHLHQIRRKDSMSSSIGATSVRRLLAVVRPIQQVPVTHKTSSLSRQTLLVNLIVVCVSHLAFTACFLPFLALQSSLTVWSLPQSNISTGIHLGSILLSLMYITASVTSYIAPFLCQKWGNNKVLSCSFLFCIISFLLHIYPALYLLFPAMVLMGLSMGLMTSTNVNTLMTVATKLTGLYTAGNNDHYEDEDIKNLRRTCIIRRVARALRGAHDIGLIFGSIMVACIVNYTSSYLINNDVNSTMVENGCTNNIEETSMGCLQSVNQQNNRTFEDNYDYNAYLEEIFDTFEGSRLCGSQACPIFLTSNINTTLENGEKLLILPAKTTQIMAGVFAGLCLISMCLVLLFMDKLKLYIYQDPLERSQILTFFRGTKEAFKDPRLQLSAPLAFFIGLEQAFIYADFSKSYVVCTLGVHRLNLVFLSMGLLQSIAACTLSMLLRSIRRYYVVAVGFTFHACLIMVLFLWKPIEDDPALFYVISASWGVCNAIWEMLSFSLLTGQYPEKWEHAFSMTAAFRFKGLSIAFLLHGLLCNYCKIYLLSFFMVVAVVPFTYLEIKLENTKKIKNLTRL